MRIARWNGATLHLIHVIEDDMVHDWAEAYGVSERSVWDDVRDMAQSRANEVVLAARRLDAQAAQRKPPNFEFNVEVIIGNPFISLFGRVVDVSADLLILGSNGSSDPARGPGVLATKCVRKMPTKVMLVNEYTAEPFKHVVACVDFSDTSRLVVEQAVRIAQQDKATMDLLHAYQLPPGALDQKIIGQQEDLDIRRRCKDQCESQLKGFTEALGIEGRDLKCEIHLIEGLDEKQEIVNFINLKNADLVIIGTRGRTGKKTVLIGTTAERIVRDAVCSVLAVKPEGFKYDVS